MEDKVTVSQIGLKNGIIVGLVLIVYGMILQFLNLEMNMMQKLDYLKYVFVIVVIVLAHKAFKEGGDGYMSIGQGLGIGTLIGLVGGAISGAFLYIYIKFIDDSILTKIKDFQVEKMEEQGMDDATIDRAMEITSKLMSAELMPVWAILELVFVGFFLSLIISLFTKKANPTLEI